MKINNSNKKKFYKTPKKKKAEDVCEVLYYTVNLQLKLVVGGMGEVQTVVPKVKIT